MHRELLDLWVHFQKSGRISVLRIDSKRPRLPIYKKIGWEAYPQLIEGVSVDYLDVKPRGRCEPQSQLLYIPGMLSYF